MPGVVTAGRLVDDRYRLLEAIEEGGMGILWRAEDLITERYVTVKELRFPDPLDHMQRRALAARVRREARAMAAVQHPGLAHIVDVVDDGDRPWVVTELIEAPTLAQLVSRDGPLAPELVAAIGLGLLDVLEAAHEQEMVHRFLQPTKVFVPDQGDLRQVRVADFGIASLIGDPAVAANGNVGGVSFMAPEQAGTPEADIWSLGAVLYFAVEGVPPFGGGSPKAILTAMATEPPRPAPRAGALASVLDATLVTDPSGRADPETLRALLEALAPPPAVPEPTPLGPSADGAADADAGEPTVAGDAIGWLDLPDDVDHGLEDDVARWDTATRVGTDDTMWRDNALDTGPNEITTIGTAPPASPSGNGTAGAPDAPQPSASEPSESQEPPSDERPAEEEQPPVAPLPGREALARMFSPDPGHPAPPIESAHADPDRQPGPPWPVAHKRSLWTVGLCTAVMAVLVVIMFTNGRDLFSPETEAERRVAGIDWVEHVDPDIGFRIEYPKGWTVSHEGIYTDFRHPDSAAALRVVAQPSTATDAVRGWLELEERFRVEQPSYRRIRLEPTEFRNYDAAEWEFVYTKAEVDLHNIDLGVVTGKHAFALNFETRAMNWEAVKPFYDRFASSFHPPTE